MLSKNIVYYGNDEPLPAGITLHAGPLSMVLEDADLRSICLGDRERLSRIYVAIRDVQWGTVLPIISDLQISSDSDSFRVTFDALNRDDDIDFFWQAEITGDASGTIRYAMDGVARSTFMRSRIGFCVLCPAVEYAGLACRVEKTDGRITDGEFPQYITPVQPFIDNMRAVACPLDDGTFAEIRFEGETFEIEDQRNWTDASFKIFGTPLSLPRPVRVLEGTRIQQSVTLTLNGTPSKLPSADSQQNATIMLEPPATKRLPRLGLGLGPHNQLPDVREIERLRNLKLAHLRVDLNLSTPEYLSSLRQAATQAAALDVSLECALIVSNNYEDELSGFAAKFARVQPTVWAWQILQQVGWLSNGVTYRILRGTDEALKMAREVLQPLAPHALFAGGTFYDFNEINALPPNVSVADMVSYSINPQRHAFDNGSMVETLAIQAETVKTCRRLCGELPIAISPITLRPRPSPVEPLPPQDANPDRLPPYVDPRQMSLFGAGWTVGSVKYLVESGVESITYFETTGWCGVMETAVGSPRPHAFPSLPGSVFPVYHVLADLGEFADGEVIPTTSNVPLRVQAVAIKKAGLTRMLVANLGGAPEQVTLRIEAKLAQVRFLDERNAERAMVSPEEWRAGAAQELQIERGGLEILLLPYGIARIDF
jgi:hypothetical protein